jgi:predicted nucleotidyltransferase component of viral defense system
LGIGDPVTPAPASAKTPALLSGEEITWSVYPIETIIAEKLHAVVARGDANSRSKDIYDLRNFLPKANSDTLRAALMNCFAYRKTEIPESFANVLKSLNTATLEKGWINAMVSIPNAPKFEEVFNDLISMFEVLE